jgi:class 3 adenylate cyclase
VTVTLTTTDGATDEATITAADIRAASDLDADHERESIPPPPPAA